jgi:hypothetical protein
LPADEINAPMVSDLVVADSVEKVQEVLAHYWWIKRWHSARGQEHIIDQLRRDYSCYDGLFKSGLAQSQDQKFIIRILQLYAVNGQVELGDVCWTEHGLEISSDSSNSQAAQHLLDQLQSGAYLGIFTGYEAVVCQEEVFDDTDEGDGEFECSACDIEEGE